jgi:hypothetical protein
MPDLNKALRRLNGRLSGLQNRRRLASIARQVAKHAPPELEISDFQIGNPKSEIPPSPVVLFNASTRISGLSLNAAFSLLTSWSLRLAGVPVVHFVCDHGMSHCVLGTNRDRYSAPPPCETCIAQSRRLYTGAQVHRFTYAANPHLTAVIQDLNLDELSVFEFQDPLAPIPLPLGRLVMPSLRWALRRHDLPDDEPTRFLLRDYILSAYRTMQAFNDFLNQVNPASVVVFNGIMFPEASVRWIAQQHGLPVITHEVSFQKFSAFFSQGQATAYPLHIPPEFELTPQQNARLDAYLEKRFQGKFTMAGIQFWPEMRGLDEAFLQKTQGFRQIVPVFTNVVFDTSQVHANTVFPHMFAWLDLILEIIRSHPETLFIIRAHPDEMRPGSGKKSRQSVQDWVQHNHVNQLPNVIFISSEEYTSSYELIQRAKFVLVYNSSIGLEATLLGAAVLCGGKARFTQYPTVFFPQTPQAYREQAEAFLVVEKIEVPAEFQRNARRFLYYQLFRASLPFENYLHNGTRPGFVHLKSISWRDLHPQNSPTMRVILNGILNQQPFLLDDDR